MDPLSAAANIITLVQAAVTIGKGVQFLRSLAEIPAEFQELLRELAILQSVVDYIQTEVRDTGSSRKRGIRVDDGFSGIDPSIILALESDLVEISHELRSLCQRLRKPQQSTQKGSNIDSNERVSKYKWQREKIYITRLRHKARTAKEHLNLCFTVFASSQT